MANFVSSPTQYRFNFLMRFWRFAGDLGVAGREYGNLTLEDALVRLRCAPRRRGDVARGADGAAGAGVDQPDLVHAVTSAIPPGLFMGFWLRVAPEQGSASPFACWI